MDKAPCQNCKKRTIGCHSNCEDYISFRQKRNAELEDIWNKKKLDTAMQRFSKERRNY